MNPLRPRGFGAVADQNALVTHEIKIRHAETDYSLVICAASEHWSRWSANDDESDR